MIPENLQWTQVVTDTKFQRIVMDNVIEKSLGWWRTNGYDVAYFKGSLREIDRKRMDIDIGDVKNKNVIDSILYKLRKSEYKGQDEDMLMDESTDDINKITINYPRNDGHSLLFMGDLKLYHAHNYLRQNKMAAELYGDVMVAGKSGEVRFKHKDQDKTRLSVNATLTSDYFDIMDKVTNQYHLI